MRFLFLTLLALVGCATAPPPSVCNPASPYSALPSLARLETDVGRCSGVLVGPNVVATAAHCLDEASQAHIYLLGAPGVTHAVTDVALHPTQDVALVWLRDVPSPHVTPVVITSTAPRTNVQLYAHGYGCHPKHALCTNHVRCNAYRGMLATHGASCNGDSGGPLLNRRGELVGIHLGYTVASGRRLWVGVNSVRELLSP